MTACNPGSGVQAFTADTIVNQLRWKDDLSQSVAAAIGSQLRSKTNQEKRLPSIEWSYSLLTNPVVLGHILKNYELNDRALSYFIGLESGRQVYIDGSHLTSSERRTLFDLDLGEFGSPNSVHYSLCIDVDDSIQAPELDGGQIWATGLDSASSDIAVGKVRASADLIRETNGMAFRFVHSFTRVLSLKRDLRPSQGSAFSTYTFQAMPGLIILSNPDLEAVTTHWIEETLLHESIHCFLYWIEFLSGNFFADPLVELKTILSPWTGNELHYHTAVHATMVWFGLRNYFQNVLESSSDNERVSWYKTRLREVEAGFLSPRFSKFVDTLERGVAPNVSQLLGIVCDDLQGARSW